MQKYNKRLELRLDEKQFSKLNDLSEASGHPVSVIIRSLIDNATIREMPHMDYHNMIGELHKIGGNLNQIA